MHQHRKFVLAEHFTISAFNSEREYQVMFFFVKHFRSIKRYLEDLLEEIQDMPDAIINNREKVEEGNILICIQVKMNMLYSALLKDNYPFFFEYFQSRILTKPYLKGVLKYIKQYLLIVEKHIESNYADVQYYDEDKGLELPTKQKFSEVYSIIESVKEYLERIKMSFQGSCICIHPLYVNQSVFDRLRWTQMYHPIRICEELVHLEQQKVQNTSTMLEKSRVVEFEEQDQDQEDDQEQEMEDDYIAATQEADEEQLYCFKSDNRLLESEMVFRQKKQNVLKRKGEPQDSRNQSLLPSKKQQINRVDCHPQLTREILKRNHQSNTISFLGKRQKRADEDLGKGVSIRFLNIQYNTQIDGKQQCAINEHKQLGQELYMNDLNDTTNKHNADQAIDVVGISHDTKRLNKQFQKARTNNLERRFVQIPKDVNTMHSNGEKIQKHN